MCAGVCVSVCVSKILKVKNHLNFLFSMAFRSATEMFDNHETWMTLNAFKNLSAATQSFRPGLEKTIVMKKLKLEISKCPMRHFPTKFD